MSEARAALRPASIGGVRRRMTLHWQQVFLIDMQVFLIDMIVTDENLHAPSLLD